MAIVKLAKRYNIAEFANFGDNFSFNYSLNTYIQDLKQKFSTDIAFLNKPMKNFLK